MDAREYETMFRVEDRHWWYAGMREISVCLLRRAYPEPAACRVLDAGCGTGAAMRHLEPFGSVTGVDASDAAVGFCHERGLTRLCRASVGALPFGDGCFDLVTSFDVLYHRDAGEPRAVLAECQRVLRPGGRVFLRLPAYDWLRGHHDRVIHTARRFTAGGVRRLLVESGFEAERVTYANTLLFPLAAAKRLSERIVPPRGEASDVTPNPPWLDALLVRVLRAEARWLARFDLPFGLSVIAIGRKLVG